MTAPLTNPVPSDAPIQPGDVIAEKYRVTSVVATGGMGMVFEAVHLQLGHQVAIKVLLPSELTQDNSAVARFLREARAAANLQSDHVVRIHDVGTLPNQLPFMVMELLRGEDLRALVRREGPLPVTDVVRYVLQACDAIDEAHANGIVHRDLKPSNLFLTSRRDGSGSVKVLDFGISKAQPGVPGGTLELTTSSVMMGSPLYMSPEQIRDARAVDGRTDIWALGIILYQLLAGRPPFTGDSLPSVCASIAADPPLPLTRPDVPLELVAIIEKCLAKRPEHRFQTVAELVQCLAPLSSEQLPLRARGAAVGPTTADEGQARSRPSEPTIATGSKSHALVDASIAFGGPVTSLSSGPVSYGKLLSNTEVLRAPPFRTPVESAEQLAATFAQPPRRGLAAVAGGLALLLVALVAVLLFVERKPAREAPAAGAPTATPETFTLVVNSQPPGARLYDGDRVVGDTPVTLTLDAVALASTPKQLRLALPGHVDVRWVQGPARGEVTLHRELAPLAAAVPVPPSATPDRPVNRPRLPLPKASSHPVIPGDIKTER